MDAELQTSQSWYAFIDFIHLSQVEAFITPAGSDEILSLGNMRTEFELKRQPIVRLPGNIDRFTFYLRVDNESIERILLPVRLISADALVIKIALDYLFYGGIIVGVIALIPYNLFLYISLRNPMYFSLVIFLICLVLILQRASNVIPWLSPFSNPSSFYYPLSYELIGISSLQIWRQLTDSKNLFPRIDKFMFIALILMIIQLPFLQVLPYTNLLSDIRAAVFILILSCLTLIALYKTDLYKKSHTTISLAISSFIFTGSATPSVLWGIGLLDELNGPVRLFHVGLLLCAILLSTTLAEHTRQLRLQTERAKTDNQAKDNFLTTMSHELRTPMHAISSAAHLLKTTALSTTQATYLDKLETSTDHMLALINRTLDLARINSNEFKLENQPFRLEETLRQVTQLLSEEAAQKNLQFHIESDTPGTNQLLIGDQTRLQQILLNLLFNAIKFTHQGSITLAVKTVPNANAPENKINLQFHVTDTGVGIPEEQQQYIFQSFSQADNSNTRQYGGSGLGLAISHKLVNQMGGKLELTSTPGEGSHFFFTLELLIHDETDEPLKLAVSTPPTESVSGIGSDQGNINYQGEVTALLVDDFEISRFLGSKLLEALGVSTITAGSGKEALQKIQQQTEVPIDLVFMDVSMPEWNGYETTQQIRSDSRFTDLPIIALTAHAIEGERERCLEAGMNDYLSKPFELKQLQVKIKRWTPDTLSGDKAG